MKKNYSQKIKSAGTGNRKTGTREPRRTKSSTKRYPKNYRAKKTYDSKENKLRVFALGGLEEVGRNMSVLEYGNDIIIIDMGLQFPEEDMPGIDYIIPDITYLKKKAKNIRGVIITHGHYDHIGAISHLCPQLGNPPIYTAKLTAGLIKKRHEEYSKKNPLDITIVDPEKSKVNLGKFSVEFFRVNHNIPDSFGVAVDTPMGVIAHTGDFKIDLSPIGDKPINLNRIAQIGGRGVLALMADSTDAGQSGHQLSESEITGSIEKIFAESKGRIIFGTFASLLNRIQQIITVAEENGRRVYLDGRSMNNNVEIAQNLGYIKIKKGTLIRDQKEFKRLPDHKVAVVGTGAQGEKNAVLNRIAMGEHRFIKVKPGDSVVFSSSVIPGNERTVQSLKDAFYRQKAKVYHYQHMDIHAGGHAKQEDLKLIIHLFKPKYFIPIEANHFMLQINGQVAESVGIPKENIFIANNGQIIEFSKKQNQVVGKLTSEKVPTEYVMVDGLGVGDVSAVVLRDRRMMSEDGMFVVIATVRKKTGQLVGSPDIISRGFVFMKESRELIEQARGLVKKIVGKDKKHGFDPMLLKNKLRDHVGDLLYKKTRRRPMVMPVIIEV